MEIFSILIFTIFILLLVAGVLMTLSGLMQLLIGFGNGEVPKIRVGVVRICCGIVLCLCSFGGRIVLPKFVDYVDSRFETNVSDDSNTADSSEDTILTSTPVPKKDNDTTFKERDKCN